MGNLLADAIYDHEQDVDISVINDGGIRAGIAQGNITTADLLTVLPFPNFVSIFSITGREIMNSLEYISARITNKGVRIVSLCHWAGLKYTYSKQAGFLNKVTEALVISRAGGYEPIVMEKMYKIAANDFLTAGGDNIFDPVESVNGRLLSEIVQDYIEVRKIIVPTIGDRITIID